MSIDNPHTSKNILRKEMCKIQKLYANFFQDKDDIILQKIIQFDCIMNCKSFFIYFSKETEVSTKNLISFLLSKNKRIFVPKIIKEEMCAIEIYSIKDCISIWRFWIYEPLSDIAYRWDIDVAIVPWIAFDKRKNRLWRWCWFYDKFLSTKNITKIGVAYDFQLFDFIPFEPHDIKMDYIFTESVVYPSKIGFPENSHNPQSNLPKVRRKDRSIILRI